MHPTRQNVNSVDIPLNVKLITCHLQLVPCFSRAGHICVFKSKHGRWRGNMFTRPKLETCFAFWTFHPKYGHQIIAYNFVSAVYTLKHVGM